MPPVPEIQFPAPWFKHDRPRLSVAECACAAGCDEKIIRGLVDSGVLVAAKAGEGALRDHLRLERYSVEAWLLNGLEDAGHKPPIHQGPLVVWWRAELRSLKPRGRKLPVNQSKRNP